MNSKSVAPCGVICDLCLGFQRTKNKCVGCNYEGNKPDHCTNCSIKNCSEEEGHSHKLCNSCTRYPCRRIRDLDKRYRIKYGESIIENFQEIEILGIGEFVKKENEKWKCNECGNLLCVHNDRCLSCGAINDKYPVKQ